MKAVKVVGIILVILLLVVVGAVLLLISSSGIQTSLVRRAAPDGFQVERVHLGFRGVRIDALRLEQDGAVVTLDRARISFPLWRTLRTRELHIREFIVEGLLVDLTHVQEDDESVTPEPPDSPVTVRRVPPVADAEAPSETGPLVEGIPFDGLFRAEVLWPPLRIDRLALDALVRLPGGQRTVKLDADGAGIGTAADASISWNIEYDDREEDAVLRQARIRQESRWRLDSAQRLIGVAVAMDVDSRILLDENEIPVRAEILVEANQRDDQTGEAYLVSLVLALDAQESQQVLFGEAAYEYAAGQFIGDWTLDFDTDTLGSFAESHLQGARAVLTSAGNFRMEPAAASGDLKGRLTLDASGLDQWIEELETMPAVAIRFAFDASGDPQQVMLNDLDFELLGAGDLLLQVRLEQPFGIDFETVSPQVADPDRSLLRAQVVDVPIDLVNALLPDLELSWSSVVGEITLSAVQNRFVAVTDTPFRIRQLSVAQAEERLLDDVTIEVPLRLTASETQIGFSILPLRLLSADAEWGTITVWGEITELLADQPHVELTATWRVDLPGLLAQPAAEAFRNVEQGSLAGELAARGTASAIHGTLATTFAEVFLPDGRHVDEVTVAAEFQMREEVLEFALPIRSAKDVEQTALRLSGNVTFQEPLIVSVEGQGETVWVDHFLVLAEAFQNPERPPPGAAEAAAALVEDSSSGEDGGIAADSVPEVPAAPWAGVRADATLTLAEVRMAEQPAIRDVILTAKVTEQGVYVDPLRARVEESDISAMVELLFNPDTLPHLYQLAAEANVNRFDVGAYLRSLNSAEEPPVEAIVTANLEVRAMAPALEELAGQATGHIRVTASEAVVRAFRQGRTGRVVDAAATAGRIGGLITGRDDVDAVGELARYFNRITFDELTVDARRNPDWTIDISRLAMRNAELQMIGTGVVSHVEGREFHQQPLALFFDVGVRSPLDRLFDRLRILEEEAREDGYRRVDRPLMIEGNVGEPDPRPFWAILIDAGARRVLPDRRSSEGEEREPDREPRSPLDRLQRYL